MNNFKVAILVSGCGYLDGAEINEVMSVIYALSKRKISFNAFSLDMMVNPVNHLNSADFQLSKELSNEHKAILSSQSEQRNMLVESARIFRGAVSNLSNINIDQFDALIITGGFGVAKHLSDWAINGANCSIHNDVAMVINQFFECKKPIGALCIAPVLLAKVLGMHNIKITLGDNEELFREVRKTGALVEKCSYSNIVVDEQNKIITTPAFMYDDADIYDIFNAVENLVDTIVNMANGL